MEYAIDLLNEEMSVDLVVKIPGGSLRRAIDLSPNPGRPGRMTLAEFCRQILPLIDEIFGQLAIQTERSCKRHCSACCRQLVTLSIPEALLLAEIVKAESPENERKYRSRFIDALIEIESAGLSNRLKKINDPRMSEEDHYHLAQNYFAMRLACPFLEKDECSIYAARFATCREYAVSSVNTHCADPFLQDVEIIGGAYSFRDALAAFAADLLNEPLKLIPIPMALNWAEEQEELAERSWDSKEMLKKFMPYFEVVLGGVPD